MTDSIPVEIYSRDLGGALDYDRDYPLGFRRVAPHRVSKLVSKYANLETYVEVVRNTATEVTEPDDKMSSTTTTESTTGQTSKMDCNQDERPFSIRLCSSFSCPQNSRRYKLVRDVHRGGEWEDYHTPTSVAISISIEANELLEIFQWHANLKVEAYKEEKDIQAAAEEELTDVVLYCLSLATQFDIDLLDPVEKKLDENEQRFTEERTATMSTSIDEF